MTDKGFAQAETLCIQLFTIFNKIDPSTIVTSPMTRTIQTAHTLFPSAFITEGPNALAIPLHIWPDLREAHDAICNQGRSRAEMEALHPGLDFSACDEEWDYKPHCFEDTADRAAEVWKELMNLSGRIYKSRHCHSHQGQPHSHSSKHTHLVCNNFHTQIMIRTHSASAAQVSDLRFWVS